MKLSDILSPELILIKDSFKDKWELINRLIDVIIEYHSLSEEDGEKVRTQIIEREKQSSTGIGEGIAIPHGLVDIDGDIMASMGIIKEGIDFEAIDNKKVYIVVVIAVPRAKFSDHIRILAKTAHLVSDEDLKDQLIKASSSKEAYELIKSYEEFI